MESINATKTHLETEYERELTTAIRPLTTFYNAEDYHQKYNLQRHRELMKAFNAVYPDFAEFVDSTSAARLNGFVAGQGTRALFEEEKSDYGFSLEELNKVVRLQQSSVQAH